MGPSISGPLSRHLRVSIVCISCSFSESNAVRGVNAYNAPNTVSYASATTANRGESAKLSPGEEKKGGLTRERLVAAALDLINREGLEALSMRALADGLEVKAASLYWHVRDRRELIELLAESILETVPAAGSGAGWRQAVQDAGAALREWVSHQKGGDRILLEVPDALERSETFAALKRAFQGGGLQPAEAAEVALLVMVYVITGRSPVERPVATAGSVASIAVDSGSRGVLLRAGADMETLVRAVHDRTTAAPAVVRGDTVVIRRLRGVGLGEIELDSGATKVECFLPEPRGVVPITLSSGVVGVTLHRPPGVAVVADISTGALRLKLDEFATKATVSDLRWESEGASRSPGRYQLRINSGVVQVTLDSNASKVEPAMVGAGDERESTGAPASAIDILLDGVESRIHRAKRG